MRGDTCFRRAAWLCLVAVCLIATALVSAASRLEPSASGRALASGLPVLFEQNTGQAVAEVKYLARAQGYTLFLTEQEAIWALDGPLGRDLVRMRCSGQASSLQPESPVTTRTSYIRGADASKWQLGVLNYTQIRYREVYPGIDLVFYSRDGRLEYDFVISPGASPELIRISFAGIQSMRLGEQGDLILKTTSGELRHARPMIYQQLATGRELVSGKYRVLDAGTVSFSLEAYDATKALILDPVLQYSTYLGGAKGEIPGGIAVDSDGNVYVAGSTGSTDYPLRGPVQNQFAGGGNPNGDIFVTKLDPTASRIIYSTYLGGTTTDIGRGIAVDSEGRAVVTGTTFSTNFPVTPGAFQTTCSGQCPFVFKLAPDGSSLIYSTFVGRGDGHSIAVDSNSQAVITGATTSDTFPVKNAFQADRKGQSEAFVSKLSANGQSLVFSTYIGGDGDDNLAAAPDISVDSAGNVYVVGRTRSDDFPTLNAVQTSLKGVEDAFAAKFSPTGTRIFSTYLGGGGVDQSQGVAADAQGNMFLTGSTLSTDFPTANALQDTFGGSAAIGDAFVAKIAPNGTNLVFSTYLGGTGGDIGSDISVDSQGRPVIVGSASANFPLLRNFRAFDGVDNFVAKLAADGSSIIYSTPVGGGDQDIEVASLGDDVYVAGNIATGTLPILNAIQSTSNGDIEAFLLLVTDAGSLHFAQFGNGAGVVSDILLTNSSTQSESHATVLFRADDGSPLALTLNVSDSTGTGNRTLQQGQLNVTVPPLGVARITSDGAGPLLAGSALVSYDSPLGGVIRFNLNPFGIAGVGESRLVRGFITPVRRTTINTGVAVFNPQNAQVGLTMRLRDKTGQQVTGGLKSMTLPAGGHLAQFITELFPNATLNNFEGTMTVEVTSLNAVVAAAALELGNQAGQFTTLPITAIP